EVAQRVDGLGVVALAADEAVDAIGVGPVGFDGDGVEAFLADQPPRDLRADRVELVRAVRRFADEHEARVADEIHERIEVAHRAGERLQRWTDRGDDLGVVHRCRSSNAWTSSSDVCVKSLYQRPTAWNGSGVRRQTTSSAIPSARKSLHVASAATGTATMIRRGSIFR